jgi:hypothetical protein
MVPYTMPKRHLPDYLPADWPDYAEIPSPEVWARAVEEDALLETALRRLPGPMTTPESIRRGKELQVQYAETTAASRAALVASGAINAEGVMQAAFHGLDPADLDQVAEVLRGLPPTATHAWLLRAAVFLGGETPAEALKNGRLKQVLALAAGYAER